MTVGLKILFLVKGTIRVFSGLMDSSFAPSVNHIQSNDLILSHRDVLACFIGHRLRRISVLLLKVVKTYLGLTVRRRCTFSSPYLGHGYLSHVHCSHGALLFGSVLFCRPSVRLSVCRCVCYIQKL